ncbi:MAG: class I SAM-dependent methyltransferase [Candidatus Bathyarchaeia archaeon]|jgi:ubiquinone/menaquinone biosynthesis C-methylase UbiE
MCAYSDWDEIYREVPQNRWGWELGKPRQLLAELVENGEVRPGQVLDLCCGVATNTVYLAQKGFTVVGIDISPTALKLAKKQAKRAKVEIGFLNGSFVDLAFANQVFDFVFDMGCFHHVEVEDRNRFIAGLWRVLKPDGLYSFTGFSDKNGPAWNHFTEPQIRRLFSAFSIERLGHFSSLEGDGVIRYFITALIRKK